MDFDTLRQIQILAMNAVENPDFSAFYRRICRWYSEKFATPLIQVEELLEYHVLQAYFEYQYDELYNSGDKDQQQAYEDLKEKVLLSPEEREELESQDQDWIEQMKREIAESAAKPEKPPKKQWIEEKVVMGETEIPTDDTE